MKPLFANLLTKGDKNVKFAKSERSGLGYVTRGLSLAPAKTSGFQTCPNATAGCKKACIFTSGYAGVFPSINKARIAKTRAFFRNRKAFLYTLFREIAIAERKANKVGKRLAVRLNVFSDIYWERLAPKLFARFSDVQFYDYTKSPTRAIQHACGELPANYHLTFSRSETNDADCLRVLAAGGNVAVVYDRKEIPSEWHGYRVINGDKTDLRFLDDNGVVVGLYAKGKGRKDASGFVVNTSRISLALA